MYEYAETFCNGSKRGSVHSNADINAFGHRGKAFSMMFSNVIINNTHVIRPRVMCRCQITRFAVFNAAERRDYLQIKLLAANRVAEQNLNGEYPRRRKATQTRQSVALPPDHGAFVDGPRSNTHTGKPGLD
ncbi:unnamed protein product, partial [Iphiclides podalirius]